MFQAGIIASTFINDNFIRHTIIIITCLKIARRLTQNSPRLKKIFQISDKVRCWTADFFNISVSNYRLLRIEDRLIR